MIQGFKYPYNTASVKLKSSGKINYIDEGKGKKTILFIHGLANYALGWKQNFEHLRKDFRCIAIDLPGNGLSERGNFPYGINYFSTVIVEFIEALRLENLVLAGHSMGGQIAITTVLNHPHIAEALVLCAPAGFEVFTPWEATMYQTSISLFDYFSSEENSLTKSIRSSFYQSTQQADTMINDLIALLSKYPTTEYRRMINACIHGMLHEPVYNSLHLIAQPTLIVFGERDAFIPSRALHPTTTRKIATDGAAKIPNSQLHLLPSCGHFVQWEMAEKVNKLITSFLK
ncbi:MAG TPA: alpha/beta hydrolase [Flavipsychrobacter sp.]|nr:alpha/beta hydrolase [Flavipsychrobacter sp.]